LLPLTKEALKALERYLEASRPDLVRHPGEQALFLSRKASG
jgi:site-specific recombinase XerD